MLAVFFLGLFWMKMCQRVQKVWVFSKGGGLFLPCSQTSDPELHASFTERWTRTSTASDSSPASCWWRAWSGVFESSTPAWAAAWPPPSLPACLRGSEWAWAWHRPVRWGCSWSWSGRWGCFDSWPDYSFMADILTQQFKANCTGTTERPPPAAFPNPFQATERLNVRQYFHRSACKQLKAVFFLFSFLRVKFSFILCKLSAVALSFICFVH